MMKALIIEDEAPARQVLVRSLKKTCPDGEVVAVTESVQDSVAWLQDPANKADIIFMDVELQDGSAFEIFRQVPVKTKVIMTTAFDRYAVKAFETGSVDYLLKPFDDQSLYKAVSRCRTATGDSDNSAILSAMKTLSREGSQSFRRRLVVRVGRQIIPVPISEIAYFHMEGKNRYIVMDGGRRYFFDQKIDDLLQELDPRLFFRISRSYVLSFHSIREIESVGGGKLRVHLTPDPGEEVLVSRLRAREFLDWLS